MSRPKQWVPNFSLNSSQLHNLIISVEKPATASKNDGFEVVSATASAAKKKKLPVLSAEELALGQVMVTSKKQRRDLMDAAWNRYMFDDKDQVCEAVNLSWAELDPRKGQCKSNKVFQGL